MIPISNPEIFFDDPQTDELIITSVKPQEIVCIIHSISKHSSADIKILSAWIRRHPLIIYKNSSEIKLLAIHANVTYRTALAAVKNISADPVLSRIVKFVQFKHKKERSL